MRPQWRLSASLGWHQRETEERETERDTESYVFHNPTNCETVLWMLHNSEKVLLMEFIALVVEQILSDIGVWRLLQHISLCNNSNCNFNKPVTRPKGMEFLVQECPTSDFLGFPLVYSLSTVQHSLGWQGFDCIDWWQWCAQIKKESSFVNHVVETKRH